MPTLENPQSKEQLVKQGFSPKPRLEPKPKIMEVYGSVSPTQRPDTPTNRVERGGKRRLVTIVPTH